MSSSQHWAGLSKPPSARKSSGRHRGQKLPGTPFFQVDPVVSLDRIDHPKPKSARRRSRKASSSKENRPSSAATNTLSVGAEFSTLSATSEGEKLSADLRTGTTTATTTFGESSVSYESADQDTQQFLANAGVDQHVDDETVIGQTITYVSGEDAVVGAAAAAADDFPSGLSLSYSSTLNCKIHAASTTDATPVSDDVDGSSYLEFSSSLCQFRTKAEFVDVPIPESAPIPEKYPVLAAPRNGLLEPLLTSTDSDREPDHDPAEPGQRWSLWSCLFCCFPRS